MTLAPKASIIHLASHGQFDKLNPMDSHLLLTPNKSDTGDLRVKELFSMDLNASLVTLSACETGLGKITSGDEVIGLNRAFFFAGADSLVSALWRISDVASAITMKRFYRYLSEGMPRAEALRKAQLLVRNLFDHPAYWASFKLTGAY
jgi:CHAT domain-containing protein